MRLPVLLLALLSSSGVWAQAQEQDLLLDCIGVREVYVNTALTERKDARQTYALREGRLIFEAPAGRVREVVPTKVGQFTLTFNAPRHPMLEFSKNYYLEVDRISGEAREQYQDASGTCGRAETFCETKFVGICKKVTQRF